MTLRRCGLWALAHPAHGFLLFGDEIWTDGSEEWGPLSVGRRGSFGKLELDGFLQFSFLRISVLQNRRSFCGDIIVVERKMLLPRRGV
jgi:hypothetical protein